MRGSVGPFTCRDGKVARIEPSICSLIYLRPGTGRRLSVQSTRVQDGKPICNGRMHTLCEVAVANISFQSQQASVGGQSFTLRERSGAGEMTLFPFAPVCSTATGTTTAFDLKINSQRGDQEEMDLLDY